MLLTLVIPVLFFSTPLLPMLDLKRLSDALHRRWILPDLEEPVLSSLSSILLLLERGADPPSLLLVLLRLPMLASFIVLLLVA